MASTSSMPRTSAEAIATSVFSRWAEAGGRVVITHDWGFGEMTIRHGQAAAGVIILSLYALSGAARDRYAVEKVAEIADQCPGCLTIIEPWRVRRRPLIGP